MLPEPLTRMSGEYLLAQGFLGLSTMVLAGVVFYLYKQNQAQTKQSHDNLVAERERHAKETTEERTRHAIEIAAERKLNAELQDERVEELRACLTAVKSVTDSVDAAIAVLGGRK